MPPGARAARRHRPLNREQIVGVFGHHPEPQLAMMSSRVRVLLAVIGINTVIISEACRAPFAVLRLPEVLRHSSHRSHTSHTSLVDVTGPCGAVP
jgi:hypothetical protein